MATPDFVLDLREKVGHALLWLPGVTAVVLRDGPAGTREVLLVRRADNGAWTPVTGIVDPGEEPAVAGAREVHEEADVVAEPVALVRVHTLPPMRYPNGDQAQYLDHTFRFRYVSGEPHPADGENTAAAWFPLDDLPPMSEDMLARVAAATDGSERAAFVR
ncbi:NUDIX hydrolase [Demequina muriae]|uniref:NUDIX domain-containing protein n=1 Tax=Demequina muriae TaxID=3051664 RepID=A0ABT8GJE8_9MICO|nr:NUDIX domain-containing protein [Demequina sp. EGI L300058]MDN4481369.1 NUDIX domain-containing protein [Demequina sp. EGI L300058]